jgi:hypothetical protein
VNPTQAEVRKHSGNSTQAEVREHSGVRQSWALALLPRGLWRQQIASPLLGLKQGLLGSPLRDLAVVTA